MHYKKKQFETAEEYLQWLNIEEEKKKEKQQCWILFLVICVVVVVSCFAIFLVAVEKGLV